MPKASEASKQAFRDLLEPFAAASPSVEVKPMFGQLGAFVNGNMFAGLFGDTTGVKLDADGLSALEAVGGNPFGPEVRPMGGYLTIPANAAAEPWIERALAYVGALPPKTPKKK
ncbi:TfoX/Sxy family protein [Nocardioides baekrokdamisoli]|nr:TfoX/Sxy family protein [Nocardioides baekrokdamisoli]